MVKKVQHLKEAEKVVINNLIKEILDDLKLIAEQKIVLIKRLQQITELLDGVRVTPRDASLH